MRAIFFDGKEACYDSNYQNPKSGEALVKVDLAGICGTDLEILDGYMTYSGIPGHEFVGTVAKSDRSNLLEKRVVGEINVGCDACGYCKRGMQRHCPNRTVLGILKRDGAFAEFLSLPEKNLHVLPDCISDEQAVFVEPLAAAFEITKQITLQDSWKVAVVGDGRLAQLILHALKTLRSCATITCFGKHPRKLKRIEQLGIKTKIGVSTFDKRLFDLVVEASGSNSGFADAMKLVRPRGTVVLKSTTAPKENGLDLTSAVVDEVTLIGSRCGLFKPAIDALATGSVLVDNMINSTFQLERFSNAFEHAKNPDTVKVFLKP